MIIKILLILFVSTFVALAQTNSAPTNSVTEFRMVGTVKYDVSKPPFLAVTIPAESELLDPNRLQFTGEVKPISLYLAVPHVKPARIISIKNFPYDPKYFIKTSVSIPTIDIGTGLSGPGYRDSILLRAPLYLRVFPLPHPTTNWSGFGEKKITPAQPVFDYGLPSD